MKALLALEDGRTFTCRSFTGPGEAWGEAVFNTSMSGYQEVLTDPSYSGQMVTMTYPLIGNYGVNPQDVESERIQVAAFLVKEYQPAPSNFRATATLAQYLVGQKIMGVEGLDTRALTRHIRIGGALRAIVSTQDPDPQSLVRRARELPSMVGLDLVKAITTTQPYLWQAGKRVSCPGELGALGPRLWRCRGTRPSVVAFDYGIKFNILRKLEAAGLEVLVVPATTPASQVKALQPDGIFLSNGPGDPEPVTYAVETIRALIGFRPIFGICLGHQLVGLALGGRTYKLRFGHRGANQPVKNLRTGRIEITSQNHGFAVDRDSLSGEKVEVTHINLNDGTVEGLVHASEALFTVQYHPEAAPGPHDAGYLFGNFLDLLRGTRR